MAAETPIPELVSEAERTAREAHQIVNRLQFLAKVQEVARRDFALCYQTYGPQAVASSLLHPPTHLLAAPAPRWPAVAGNVPVRLSAMEATGAPRVSQELSSRPTVNPTQKGRRFFALETDVVPWRLEAPQRDAKAGPTAKPADPTASRNMKVAPQREGHKKEPQLQQMHGLLREQVHTLARLESLVTEKLSAPSAPPKSPAKSRDPHEPIRSVTDIPLADRQRVVALLANNPAAINSTSTRLAVTRQTQTVMDGTTQTTRSLEQSVYSTHTVSFLSSSSASSPLATSRMSPTTPLLAELEEREEEDRRLRSPSRQPPEPEHLQGLRRIHAQIQDLLTRSDCLPEPRCPQPAISPLRSPALPQPPSVSDIERSADTTGGQRPSPPTMRLREPSPSRSAVKPVPVESIDVMLAKVTDLETETASVAARSAERRRRLQAAVDFQGLLGPSPAAAAPPVTPASIVWPSATSSTSTAPERLIPDRTARPNQPQPQPHLWQQQRTITPTTLTKPSSKPLHPEVAAAFKARPPPSNVVTPAGRPFHERRGVPLGAVDAETRRRLEADRERFVRFVASGEASWNSSHLTQYDFAGRMTEEVVQWLVQESAQELAQLLDGFVDHIVLQEVGLREPPLHPPQPT
eukprot:GGOE01001653.1.p1 GENE.GGOE01001653.1~~GGOE01001653.1.p1  ORF type:complete len:667 (-),score=116.92 GGOE01001653.1:119-2023(-)